MTKPFNLYLLQKIKKITIAWVITEQTVFSCPDKAWTWAFVRISQTCVSISNVIQHYQQKRKTKLLDKIKLPSLSSIFPWLCVQVPTDTAVKGRQLDHDTVTRRFHMPATIRMSWSQEIKPWNCGSRFKQACIFPLSFLFVMLSQELVVSNP